MGFSKGHCPGTLSPMNRLNRGAISCRPESADIYIFGLVRKQQIARCVRRMMPRRRRDATGYRQTTGT